MAENSVAMRKSLRVLLAVGFAGLQFVAVLSVVLSSYVTSERALLFHARDLMRDVGQNTTAHSNGFLNPAAAAAELAARLAQNRVIASDNPALLEQLLFQQLQIAPKFAGLYYGGQDGSFVMVMRSPDEAGPFRSKIITNHDGQRKVDLIWRNDDFTEAKRASDPSDTFDPRTRPWYRQALEKQDTIWTDPYIFFSSQRPGITLAAPVMAPVEGVRGIVGVDIEISALSEFLASLTIGSHGKALIVNHNGDVVAHPDKALIKRPNADGSFRLAKLSELGDPIAQAAFGAGRPAFTDGEPKITEFTHDGAAYLSLIMPPMNDDLPWTIAVYAPEEDFTGKLKRNRTQNIIMAAVLSLLTGLIGLALAEYAHRPVRAFASHSARVGQDDYDPSQPPPPTYSELGPANRAMADQVQARRQSEQEYGQTFEMSPRGLAKVDPKDFRLLRVNQRLCDLTGYDRDTLSSMSLCQLTDSAGTNEAITRDGELVSQREMRWRRQGGSLVWVSIQSILVRDDAGVPLHYLLAVEDISDRILITQQLDRLKADLSHRARGSTMGQMAAGLAHELNQPLTAIAQNADTAMLILDETPGSNPELRHIIAEIESQSLRAGGIIRALRSFIRKDPGERAPFDIVDLIQQTLQLVRPEATEADIPISTVMPEGLPPIEGNRVQIAQVLVNLLRNAIEVLAEQATGSGGIVVRVEPRPRELIISVEDNGPGVTSDISLFTQFETSKSGGMGLGLSICQSIIEAHGGKIWHEAGPGPSTRFRFTLPVAALS